MLRPQDLFSGIILDIESYERAVEAFASNTNYFYHGWDLEGHDLYPEYPLCVESDPGGHLVWIMGLVIGNRPGKALLLGCTKMRSFKDTITSAFEVLPGIPAAMPEDARKHSLQSLRRRMRSAVIILAKRAGLTPYNDSKEPVHVVLPVLSNPSLDHQPGQRAV
jgi:hypothetical protein